MEQKTITINDVVYYVEPATIEQTFLGFWDDPKSFLGFLGNPDESPSPRKALATSWAQEALAKRSVFSAYLTFAGENSRGESWVQSENPGFYYTTAEIGNYIQTVLKTLGVQSWEEVVSQKVLILRNSNIGIDRIEGFIHHSSSNAMVFSEI